ncbi:hypothetical protein U4E84_05580 [Halorubrum sp. AD140]|uniref:hypothetical protein n=1 Tax=Halorubrum sp. AD140 TaxID=3050073 RepID=UPI002ACD0A24|nr:hypothetical protein [Halorubrum sp. AD140]MDZ5810815.1 hypothetical protein [Halorubrum sp. AD140]
MAALIDHILDSELSETKAKSYRNGFTAALVTGFSVLSYQYWSVGELSVEMMAVFFSTAFVFVLSQYVYQQE